MTIIKNQSS